MYIHPEQSKNQPETTMKSILSLILFFGITTESQACIARFPTEALEHYEHIFIGIVTGVHLTSFEEDLLEKMQNKTHSTYADTLLPLKVSTVVKENLQGKTSGVRELEISGCVMSPPSLYSEVAFFVNGDKAEMFVPASEYHFARLRFWLNNNKKPEQTEVAPGE